MKLLLVPLIIGHCPGIFFEIRGQIAKIVDRSRRCLLHTLYIQVYASVTSFPTWLSEYNNNFDLYSVTAFDSRLLAFLFNFCPFSPSPTLISAIAFHLLVFMYLSKMLFIAETIMSTSRYLSFYIFLVKGFSSLFADPLLVITRIFDRIAFLCGFLSLPPSLQIHPIALIGAALEERYTVRRGSSESLAWGLIRQFDPIKTHLRYFPLGSAQYPYPSPPSHPFTPTSFCSLLADNGRTFNTLFGKGTHIVPSVQTQRF